MGMLVVEAACPRWPCSLLLGMGPKAPDQTPGTFPVSPAPAPPIKGAAVLSPETLGEDHGAHVQV